MIVINYVEVAEQQQQQQQHQLQSDRQTDHQYLPERLLSVDVLLLRISR